jgi:hypothetical protein
LVLDSIIIIIEWGWTAWIVIARHAIGQHFLANSTNASNVIWKLNYFSKLLELLRNWKRITWFMVTAKDIFWKSHSSNWIETKQELLGQFSSTVEQKLKHLEWKKIWKDWFKIYIKRNKLLYQLYYKSYFIKVILSELYYRSYTIGVILSGLYNRSYIIGVLL